MQTQCHHENQKKREYNHHILQIEKGSFTPVVYSCTGGSGPEASRLLKCIAQKLCSKSEKSYGQTVAYLRRRVCFDIIRTCVLSFRGERKGNAHERIAEIDTCVY